ncbi:hypothetical protein EDB19DRAFT_1825162 [Suillus lakei]|nr:hypothetical protein EDB19DRAFT_1825162 [Suillus lakei]
MRKPEATRTNNSSTIATESHGLVQLAAEVIGAVDLNCNPITAVGTGSDATCNQQSICCSDNKMGCERARTSVENPAPTFSRFNFHGDISSLLIKSENSQCMTFPTTDAEGYEGEHGATAFDFKHALRRFWRLEDSAM